MGGHEAVRLARKSCRDGLVAGVIEVKGAHGPGPDNELLAGGRSLEPWPRLPNEAPPYSVNGERYQFPGGHVHVALKQGLVGVISSCKHARG